VDVEGEGGRGMKTRRRRIATATPAHQKLPREAKKANLFTCIRIGQEGERRKMNQQKKITSTKQSKKRLGWERHHLHPFHPQTYSLQLYQDVWLRGGTVVRV